MTRNGPSVRLLWAVAAAAAATCACQAVVVDALTAEGATASTQAATDTDTAVSSDTFAHDITSDPVGFAAVDALDQPGVHGGGEAPPVVVTTGQALQDAIDAKGADPLVIHVDGVLTHPDGRVIIADQADISIIGVDAGATLDGFGLSISRSHNIVVRNLTIHHVDRGDRDCIHIASGSHHIWVDHCLLYNDPQGPQTGESPYDSLLDISDGSDFITVSWSRMRDHVKAMYVGNSDETADTDAGALHTTWHHNVFTNISPMAVSIRFGTGHLFNNRFEHLPYTSADSGIAVASRMQACVRLEYNRFVDVYTPVRTDFSGTDAAHLGAVELIGNQWGDAVTWDTTPACTAAIPYAYDHALHDPADLDALLDAYAGPR